MSVIGGLILEKIYEVFDGTNETVRNIGVSVLSGVPLYLIKQTGNANRKIKAGFTRTIFCDNLYVANSSKLSAPVMTLDSRDTHKDTRAQSPVRDWEIGEHI